MSGIQDRHQERHFDFQPLLRLVLWGGAASGALLLAVLAANSDTGRRQLTQARTALFGPTQPTEPMKSVVPSAAQLLARSQEAEAEARRLGDAVRVLSTDRDRLMARIGALERTLEDVTGSIAAERTAQRDATNVKTATTIPAAPPPTITTAPALSSTATTALPNSAPSAPPSQFAATSAAPSSSVALIPPPAIVVPSAPPANANVVLPQSQPDKPPAEPSRPASESSRVVSVEPVTPPTAPAWAAAVVTQPITLASPTPLPPATRALSADSTASKTEYAVDIGGAADIDALREFWLAAKDRYPSLETLRPAVAVRDNSKQPGPTELRLVMGPLANATAAAKLCASLSASGLTCYPTVFEGQKLAWR